MHGGVGKDVLCSFREVTLRRAEGSIEFADPEVLKGASGEARA